MGVYRPRFVARLFVPNSGTPSQREQQEDTDNVTQLQVRAHRVRLVSNSLNDADECELSINYDDAGIDPRFLRSAEVYIYLGDGDAKGYFDATEDNQRFVGIATDVAREFDESGGKNVTIRALDYTTLFLAAKQFPPIGVPLFSESLREAWRRVCKYTGWYDLSGGTPMVVSTVDRLKDRITFIPDSLGDIKLGSAVSSRLAKIGKLQTKQGADAWAVWQTAVGSVGLVSFIRNDRCIVTSATDYFTADDPPCMVYGKNIRTITERRDTHSLSSKNVGILSFNPLTMQTLEAYWPPLSYVQQKIGKGKKKIAASALGGAVVARSQDYEIFDCPMPIVDADALERFAHRVWEERSRQELRGRLVTREMAVDTLSGAVFDMLKLQGGDRIRVEIDQDALTVIQRLGSLGQRVDALQDRGYSADMAKYIATNLDSITKLSAEFQVHSVATTVETSNAESPSYDMEIEFLNRIDVSGGSESGEGTGTAPITGQTDHVKSPQAERSRNGRGIKGGP